MSRCTFLGALLASATVASAESRVEFRADAPEPEDNVIVGGTDVPVGRWPDTVAVVGNNGSCTGTLIAPDVVLTAGHCAEINPTQIIANTVDYAAPGGVRVNVARTQAYPSWETTYDVAVVVLSAPVTGVTPRKVGTNCTFTSFTPTTKVRLVGFGATDMQGTAANTKLKEAMTAVTDPTCAGGNGCNPSVAPGGEFVAGGTGTADSCFGDSGGPVYLDTAAGPVVIGAVSRGVDGSATPCGGGGIYVRTDKILQWIETTSGKTISKDDCSGGPGGTENPDGTGSGSGSGTGSGDQGDDVYSDDITGGCSTSGAGGGVFVVALALGSMMRRRRAKPAEDPSDLDRWRTK